MGMEEVQGVAVEVEEEEVEVARLLWAREEVSPVGLQELPHGVQHVEVPRRGVEAVEAVEEQQHRRDGHGTRATMMRVCALALLARCTALLTLRGCPQTTTLALEEKREPSPSHPAAVTSPRSRRRSPRNRPTRGVASLAVPRA